jgi:spore coat polysaccharide biosynthesis protein SpsF
MILAILQARMSSQRLPGKVLRPVAGVPMMHRQIERIRRSRTIEKLVVATSQRPEDDAIIASCAEVNVECRRGPLDDVLERFRLVAAPDAPEHVVRLTADCPLIDREVIDALVALHIEGGFDYSTNALRRTYPHGLDCEVMTIDALSMAAAEAVSAFDREHVTPFLYRVGSDLRIGHLMSPTDRSFFRWTVDNPEDFALIEAVYRELHPTNPAFTTDAVIGLLGRRPDLRFTNSMHQDAKDRAKAETFWRTYDERQMAENRA